MSDVKRKAIPKTTTTEMIRLSESGPETSPEGLTSTL